MNTLSKRDARHGILGDTVYRPTGASEMAMLVLTLTRTRLQSEMLQWLMFLVCMISFSNVEAVGLNQRSDPETVGRATNHLGQMFT